MSLFKAHHKHLSRVGYLLTYSIHYLWIVCIKAPRHNGMRPGAVSALGVKGWPHIQAFPAKVPALGLQAYLNFAQPISSRSPHPYWHNPSSITANQLQPLSRPLNRRSSTFLSCFGMGRWTLRNPAIPSNQDDIPPGPGHWWPVYSWSSSGKWLHSSPHDQLGIVLTCSRYWIGSPSQGTHPAFTLLDHCLDWHKCSSGSS